jgi:hypothetical protein
MIHRPAATNTAAPHVLGSLEESNSLGLRIRAAT